jgi:hypothetical protein
MKTLFKVIASIMVITIFTANTYAQTNRSGLYLTAQDYTNKKLSYSNDNSYSRYKIKVMPFLNKDRVQVIQNGEKHNFFQFDLFGYRDKNQDYWFFNDQQYKVVDNSFFYMYTRDVTVDEGKAHTKKTNYYFSKKADGNIMDLTLENLKEAFPNNHKFQDLLDAYFRYDDDLKWYDSFNKMYKVEHIFGDTFDKTAYSFNQ